jgi:hypothetical protein
VYHQEQNHERYAPGNARDGLNSIGWLDKRSLNLIIASRDHFLDMNDLRVLPDLTSFSHVGVRSENRCGGAPESSDI